LIGVPGLGKTLLVNSLAQLLDLKFKRVQFTPDLMPTDIVGTEIIEENTKTGERKFRFIEGPIFSQILLADEINRTPPKTQAALLQAMQEKSITSGGTTYKLDEPFFVLATQNPIEQEGTYPLPEAQLDRFMFNIRIEYPPVEDEITMVRATTGGAVESLKPVLDHQRILELQEIVRRVPVSDRVIKYAVSIAETTRPGRENSPDFINDYVTWGAGPRASQYLILGAKARAVLHGRFYVACEDIRALAYAVLRHRILINFNAEAEGVTSDSVIEKIIKSVAEPAG
jgi:MoxR-like ATPase